MKRKAGFPHRQIRGVLFDFDGTLTRPGAIDFAAIRQEIRCPEEIPILEYLERLPVSDKAELLRILDRREEEAARASLPNEGAEACLLALKKRGIPFAILTRNSLKSVLIALGSFRGIRPEDFAAILTRENSLPKPHPDGVFRAAARMGIPVMQLMMVGDFRFDVMAGKEAEAFTVLLRNQGEPVRDGCDPEPDHTIERIDEILALLQLTSR